MDGGAAEVNQDASTGEAVSVASLHGSQPSIWGQI